MMRDRCDNVVVVCSIENLDPMGVHTGDSITVAPVADADDKEYQRMRDAAITIMRAVGVETGGSNIQFALDPATGRMVAIEMNPRVSRSSALASQGDRVPDRQDRDQARDRLHARRDPQRHHARDSGLLRAGDRLLRGQDAALRLREVPGRRRDAHHLDEVASARRWRSAARSARRSRSASARWRSSGTATASIATTAGSRRCASASRSAPRPTGPSGSSAFGDEARARRPSAGRTLGEAAGRSEGALDSELADSRGGADREDRHAVPGPSLLRPLRAQARLVGGADSRALAHRPLVPRSARTTWCASRSACSNSRSRDGAELSRHARSCSRSIAEASAWGYSEAQLRNIWRVDAGGAGAAPAPHRPAQVQAGRHLRRRVRGLHALLLLHASSGRSRRSCKSPEAVAELTAPPAVARPERARRGDPQPRTSNRRPATACWTRSTCWSRCYDDELRITDKPKVVVLGGGPNRIGQGIEFDYCCVHASMAARELGYETVMINSNPETVSTDYDASDLLFFEPLTHEDVLNICERLNGRPFKPHNGHPDAGPGLRSRRVRPVRRSDAAQSGAGSGRGRSADPRHLFGEHSPRRGSRAVLADAARARAAPAAERHRVLAPRRPPASPSSVGYPVLVRPSYVLGGRGMQVCNNRDDLRALHRARAARHRPRSGLRPAAIRSWSTSSCSTRSRSTSTRSATTATRAAIRPRAAATSAASWSTSRRPASTAATAAACCRPTRSRPRWWTSSSIRSSCSRAGSQVCGLMNVQFAIQGRVVYIIEVNPRASRTIPFVSKATGVPWAKIATRVMLGQLARREPCRARHPRGADAAAPVGQGSGVPVQALPRRRFRARPRDAEHRRGDGNRRQLPDGVRQGPARGRAWSCRPRAGCW